MDIKPDNIMVDEEMNPIIIDFGLCGTVHPENGTPDYFAPEQLAWNEDHPERNPLKFDTWQLGMVVFLCLGGKNDHVLF